ncbi:DUF3887 domain-containing protein [Evansella tamaricis]|uniref:DUF3887 domain-containing protein n=1 Tax=Evansella tamaricis TaxID=2069301 RepID=A0ABS6JE32_9BACI|nr:DUF3887 domain-containing protein [Evansella tamaricis]
MKKIVSVILLGTLLISGCNGGGEQGNENEEVTADTSTEETASNNIDEDEAVSLAEQFIEHLSAGEFGEGVGQFNEEVAAQLGAEELKELWETLESQIGTFIDAEFQTTQVIEEYLVVLISGLFEAADVTFTVTIDENYQIAGFFIQ